MTPSKYLQRMHVNFCWQLLLAKNVFWLSTQDFVPAARQSYWTHKAICWKISPYFLIRAREVLQKLNVPCVIWWRNMRLRLSPLAMVRQVDRQRRLFENGAERAAL